MGGGGSGSSEKSKEASAPAPSSAFSSDVLRAAVVIAVVAILVTFLTTPLLFANRWFGAAEGHPDDKAIGNMAPEYQMRHAAKILNGTASIWTAGEVLQMCFQKNGTACQEALFHVAEQFVHDGEPLLAHALYDLRFNAGANSGLSTVLATRSSVALHFAGMSEQSLTILKHFSSIDVPLLKYIHAQCLATEGQCETAFQMWVSRAGQFPLTSALVASQRMSAEALVGGEEVQLLLLSDVGESLALAVENEDFVTEARFMDEEDEDEVAEEERVWASQVLSLFSVSNAVVDVLEGCAATNVGGFNVITLGNAGAVTHATRDACATLMEMHADGELKDVEEELEWFDVATTFMPMPSNLHDLLVMVPSRLELLASTVLSSADAPSVVLLLPVHLQNTAVERIASLWTAAYPSLHTRWLADEDSVVRVRHLLVPEWVDQSFLLFDPNARLEHTQGRLSAPPPSANDVSLEISSRNCYSPFSPPSSLTAAASRRLAAHAHAAPCPAQRGPLIVWTRAEPSAVTYQHEVETALRGLPGVRVRTIDVGVRSLDEVDTEAVASIVACADVLVGRAGPSLAVAAFLRPGASVVELPHTKQHAHEIAKLLRTIGVHHWTVPSVARGHRAAFVTNATSASRIARTVSLALAHAEDEEAPRHVSEPRRAIAYQDVLAFRSVTHAAASRSEVDTARVDHFLRSNPLVVSTRTKGLLEEFDATGSVWHGTDACRSFAKDCRGAGKAKVECEEAVTACWRMTGAVFALTSTRDLWEEVMGAELRSSVGSLAKRPSGASLTAAVDTQVFEQSCFVESEMRTLAERLLGGTEAVWAGASDLHCLALPELVDATHVSLFESSCWETVLASSSLSPFATQLAELHIQLADVRCFLDVFHEKQCLRHPTDAAAIAASLESLARALPLSLGREIVPILAWLDGARVLSLAEDTSLPLPFREEVFGKALFVAEQFEAAAKHLGRIPLDQLGDEHAMMHVYARFALNKPEGAAQYVPAIQKTEAKEKKKGAEYPPQVQLQQLLRNRFVQWEEEEVKYNESFALPPRRPYEESDRRFAVAVCAAVRDESAYLEEWIEYHRLVGVEHFFLVVQNPDGEWFQRVQPYENAGIVTVKLASKRERLVQARAGEMCMEEMAELADWIALIDADEFLVPKEDDNLRQLLSRFQDKNGLFVAERRMSSFPHRTQPDALVTEAYQYGTANTAPLSPFGKAILNMRVAPMDGLRFADHDGSLFHNPLPESSPLSDEFGHPLNDRWFVAPPTRALVQYNHYQSKSVEECGKKVERAEEVYATRFISRREAWPEFAKRRASTDLCGHSFAKRLSEKDGSIDRFIPALKERLSLSIEDRVAL